ncbi:MAG: Type II secretion system protein E [Chlamydiia bacterium]|nr:Type II secretion system protein E [Chlamydiia bacterium]MCH9616321.1 Type II secretion system protein E [Chlamydiia bacterium]MCH9629693.1 Type II secretion system protein E [Chlamydiia bacterium]
MTSLDEMPLVDDLSKYPFVPEEIPYAFAKAKEILPLELKGNVLTVAIANPNDLAALEEARLLTGRELLEMVCPKERVIQAIEKCYKQGDDETSQLIANLKGSDETLQEEKGYDLLDDRSDSPVIRMLNSMIVEAAHQGASDIHFEPQENGMVVRYRIDGVLQKRHSPPKEFQKQLLTRIKVIAKLDIAQQRLPQDGRIKLNMAGRQIDFRVSTVPVVYGERIVLRILDNSNVMLGLDKMGMPYELLSAFRRLIRKSQGIILVTGPTGSGKTTTLYSALSEVNSPEVNVMTIEDPVEYKLPGIAQIGINPKIDLTFAAGLRHILRQDPDVVMIGEIRDQETAVIATQASLTGHLVLSTLHTNDAPSAMTRLVEMGIEPYLLSSSVLAVLAQRLVRALCPKCKEAYTPEERELTDLGIKRSDLHDGMLFQGKGCEECYGTGYRGRRGVYELMELTPAVKTQLMKSAEATKLSDVAGVKSLRMHGASLAIEGVTTSKEVLRVTR